MTMILIIAIVSLIVNIGENDEVLILSVFITFLRNVGRQEWFSRWHRNWNSAQQDFKSHNETISERQKTSWELAFVQSSKTNSHRKIFEGQKERTIWIDVKWQNVLKLDKEELLKAYCVLNSALPAKTSTVALRELTCL